MNGEITDMILVLGDCNLPKIGWSLQGERVGLMPVNVTTDLESDMIEGLLSCDLGQINAIANQSVFSNAGEDVSMCTCESPILKLDRHHRAYELSVDRQGAVYFRLAWYFLSQESESV
jgi:hypothetical protein